jgi:hypothetical protein
MASKNPVTCSDTFILFPGTSSLFIGKSFSRRDLSGQANHWNFRRERRPQPLIQSLLIIRARRKTRGCRQSSINKTEAFLPSNQKVRHYDSPHKLDFIAILLASTIPLAARAQSAAPIQTGTFHKQVHLRSRRQTAPAPSLPSIANGFARIQYC